MHSSTIWCDSSYGRVTSPVISPSSSSVTSASGISMSRAPAAKRFALSFCASAEISRIVLSSRLPIFPPFSHLPSPPRMTFITCSYVKRAFERMTLFANSLFTISPDLSNVMNTENASLSSPGTSEHTPLERLSGSIGTTLSHRYTLVERRYASRSIALPGFT